MLHDLFKAIESKVHVYDFYNLRQLDGATLMSKIHHLGRRMVKPCSMAQKKITFLSEESDFGSINPN